MQSIIIKGLNSVLEYSQSKFAFVREKSFFLQNFDTLVFASILITILAGLFCSSGIIGLCIFITLFLSVINLFITPSQKFAPKAFDIALFVFLIISLISMFNSTLVHASLKGLFKTLTYIGFYFSSVQYFSKNKSKIKYIVWVITGCIAFESVIAIIQNHTNVLPLASWQDLSKTNAEDVLSRAFGTLKPYNPNLLAAYFILGFPMVLCTTLTALFNKQKILFILSAIFSALSGIAIIYTGSRGAYLGLGAILFFAVLISFRIIFYDLNSDKLKKLWQMIVAGGFGCVTLIILFTPSVLRRILSIFVMREDSSTSFRMNVYKSSWAMFQDNPILGIGLGNTTFREIYGYYMLSGYDALSAYSIYLETAVETGIIGLISFISLFVLLIIPCVKFIFSNCDIKEKIFISCCLLSVIGAMTHGCFDTVFFRPQVQTLFWLTAAIMNVFLTDKNKEF